MKTAAETTVVGSNFPTDEIQSGTATGKTSETSVVADPKQPRSSKRATVECREGDALSTLKFSTISETQPCDVGSSGDATGAELGIALVASGLGKRVPSVSTAQVTAGMLN